MKEIYAKVDTKDFDLSRAGVICDSKLEYYITKEKSYGIEIVKVKENKNVVDKEVKNILDISEDISKVKQILDLLVERKVKPYIAEEIINDLAIC